MEDTDFPKARIFTIAPSLGFPIPVQSLEELKEEIMCGSEITVFDLTEPRSVAFTKNSFPQGGMR